MTEQLTVQQYETVTKYDRQYRDAKDNRMTKPSTIKHVDELGRAETFLIQTARFLNGDYKIFIEYIDASQNTMRLCLPAKAANVIVSQRTSLAKQHRAALGKSNMKKRMAEGEKPGAALAAWRKKATSLRQSSSPGESTRSQ